MPFTKFSIFLKKPLSLESKIILVLVILIFLVFLIYSFWPKEVFQPVSTPQVTIPETTSEILKPGKIGEEKGVTSSLPPVSFNTTGIISEVGSNKLIVEGDGSNFTDQKPRTLIVVFSDSTITFQPGQKIKYQGFEGLKYLEEGMEILIEGEENLRGKTIFLTRTINIL